MRARIALGSFACLSIVACSGTPPTQPGMVPPTITQVQPNVSNPVNNLIGVSDVLSVTVYREPDISLPSVTVDPDGNIQMPLVGNVHVAGKSPAMLAGELQRALNAKYVVDPNVAVNVVTAASRRITVEGAVTDPGIYPYQPNIGLIDALALAKGPTRVGRIDQVSVFRNKGSERYVGVFDVQAIRSGRAPDLAMQPGDVVVVGISGRQQAWQDFLQAAPLIGVFTRF